MNREYGELMSFLLQRREMFDSDEKFRRFVVDSVRGLSQDLKGLDLNVDLTIKPDVLTPHRSSRDWNSLKIGCE